MFSLVENKLSWKHCEQNQVDGVELTDDEKEYLLPHFLMLLVGKPGSGKTTLLKQLLTNSQMYFKKFDDVFLVSPSYTKMGLKIKQENAVQRFSLDWIFKKIDQINEEQMDDIFGARVQRTNQTVKSREIMGQQIMLNDQKSRFLLSDAFQQASGKDKGPSKEDQQFRKEQEQQQRIQHKYSELKKMPLDKQRKTHRNVLFVLDDVVGQVKKAEFDPRLAQLVMNRRHLIFNGTISLIFVTQKYTLIPARIRSNANWLILYQLNPMDFETAYRDAVTLSTSQWHQLLEYTYGIRLLNSHPRIKPTDDEHGQQPTDTAHGQRPRIKATDSKNEEEKIQVEDNLPDKVESKIGDELKNKKYENMGIWVECNLYFKNFKRIKF